MPIRRTDEYEYVPDNSPIAESFSRRLNAYYNGQDYQQQVTPKEKTVQEYVNTLINRAGMTEYINMVNSQLEHGNKKEAQQLTSVLQIPKIRDAVDKALASNQFSSPYLLLAKLQEKVKTDKDVPEALKNVVGDKQLNEYLKETMGSGKQEKVDYSLTKQITENQNGAQDNYFSSFDSGNQKK